MELKYKLIATDLDDTLLRNDRSISQNTVDTINRLARAGVKFTISTGRMYDSTTRYLKQLQLDVPVITYNGAMIKDPAQNKVIYHCPLDNDLAKDVLMYAKEIGHYSQIYLDDVLYCEELGPETEIYGSQTGNFAIPLHKPLYECLTVPTTKIIIIMPKEKVQQLLPEVRKRYEGKLLVTVSKPEYMEFLNPAAGKDRALAFLAEQYNIKPEEIMAFGDALNDISMLQYAGRGVAVANAKEEVKQIADDICPSNEEDGVAQYLQEHVLKDYT